MTAIISVAMIGTLSMSASAYVADRDILVQRMRDAIESGKVTYATMYDIDEVQLADLQYVAKEMAARNGKVLFQFCTLKDKEIVARMIVNPNLVKSDEGTFDPYIVLEGDNVKKVTEKFTKQFEKPVRVIECGNLDLGMTVVISAKLDFKGMDKSKLKAYSYDIENNSYKLIENSTFQVDEYGFVNFQTSRAGYVILTES